MNHFQTSVFLFVVMFTTLLSSALAYNHTFTEADITTTYTIQDDDEIRLQDSCYVGSTFEVPSGVIFYLDSEASLTIGSGVTFTAEGITFTSSEGTPSAGDWGSIKFEGNSTNEAIGELTNCTFSYGGDYETDEDEPSGPIVIGDYSSVSIDTSIICKSYGSGIGVEGANPIALTARFNKIYQCESGLSLRNANNNSDYVLQNNEIFAIEEDAGNTNAHALVGTGINSDLGTNTSFEMLNNLIFNIENDGAYISYNGTIENNTVATTGGSSFYLHEANTAYYAFNDNLCYDFGNTGIVSFSETINSSYCLTYSNRCTTNYVHLFAGDFVFDSPEFANENSSASEPGTFDYHLLWTSPALHEGDIDTAMNNPNGTTNDIGAFGGHGADPYYVAVKGYVSDDDPFDEQDSPYKVIDDIQLQAEEELTIEDTLTFEMYADTEFLVQGDLSIGESGDTDEVLFREAVPGEGWDGISIYHSGVTLTPEFYHLKVKDATIGIEVMGENLSMYRSEIASCSLGVKITGASGGLLDSCKIHLNDAEGIYLNNSTPNFRSNTVINNDLNGIRLLSGSDLTFGLPWDAGDGNLFESNGDNATSDANGAEVYISSSDPTISNCSNDFIDDRSSYNDKLFYNTNPSATLVGTKNYFEGYSSISYKDWFEPRCYVTDYDNWSSSNNRTSASVSNFESGALAENQGNYEEAVAYYYLAFVNDDNLTAFSAWVRARILYGDDLEDILDDVQGYLIDSTLGRTAFWKQISIQNMQDDFETSILQLDDFISNAATEEDSLIGLLCQLDTYYQMALANISTLGKNFSSPTINRDDPLYISQVGIYEESVPYSINDYHAKCANLNSRITASNGDGEITDNTLPETFELEKAYPNPFNPATTIGFKLPETSRVTMIVFDVLGREVATILDKEMTAGSHAAVWSGKDASGQLVASGIYFVTMNAESFTASQKLILLK